LDPGPGHPTGIPSILVNPFLSAIIPYLIPFAKGSNTLQLKRLTVDATKNDDTLIDKLGRPNVLINKSK